jgi:hypothetical protein
MLTPKYLLEQIKSDVTDHIEDRITDSINSVINPVLDAGLIQMMGPAAGVVAIPIINTLVDHVVTDIVHELSELQAETIDEKVFTY